MREGTRLPLFAALFVFASFFLSSGCGVEPDSPVAPGPSESDVVPGIGHFAGGEVIICLEPGVSIHDINSEFGTILLGQMPILNVFRLGVPNGTTPEEMIEAMSGSQGIVFAEGNMVVENAESLQLGMAFCDGSLSHGDYVDQDVLARVRVTEAHNVSVGDGVAVAILDTGADLDHPDLRGSFSGVMLDLIDKDNSPDDLPDYLDNDGDGIVDESAGHGSHVAGIVRLVSPEATIMPVRVLDSDGRGQSFSVAVGLVMAVIEGADVVNLSLSMPRDCMAMQLAVDWAIELGVVLVASAGNDGQAGCHYPAGHDGVCAVAAVDRDDVKPLFSNYSADIDVCAPGVGIVSSYFDGGYAVWSGSSMAAPFVSGLAALLVERFPGSSSQEVVGTITTGAISIEGLNSEYEGLLGSGRIDCLSAVLPGGQRDVDPLPSPLD